MPTPNPKIAEELRRTKEELSRIKEEKSRLYPANPHPFAEPDHYPRDYTPEQIRQRNALVERIEELERRIDELEGWLYSK